jgi:HK97 family phage portal protein
MLERLKTKAVTAIRRALSLTDPSTWPGYNTSEAGETVTGERIMGLSTAWACVNLNAGTIGSLPLLVYKREKDGSRAIAYDHWLYKLIHDSPNAEQTALDFWEFIQTSLELRGNGYARAPRAQSGRVIALIPISADYMEVRRLDDGRLQYEYPGPKGERVKVAQSEMFHIRGFGGGVLGGLSTIAFGRHAFGLAIAVDKTASSTFKNGIRPSGILRFANWLKPDQRGETRDILERDHMGAGRSGKPLILEGGVEFMKTSFSPEEGQMLESRQFSVEEICRFFGVPPVLIGHTEKVSAWGTGISEITEGFVKFTLRRRCQRIEQCIEKQLMLPEDRAAGYFVEFSLEGLLRGSPKARAEFYKTMVSIGVMTINECRRLENLPPVPGGDVPRLQMQNVPLSDDVSLDDALKPKDAISEAA